MKKLQITKLLTQNGKLVAVSQVFPEDFVVQERQSKEFCSVVITYKCSFVIIPVYIQYISSPKKYFLKDAKRENI